MDKDAIRIGDEVEVVYTGIVRRKNGNFVTLSTGPSFRYEAITRVLARHETAAEKIENLERDKAFWKASAESYMNTIIELQDKLITAEEAAEMKPHSVKLDDTVAPGKMTMIDASGKPKWTVCFKPKPAAGPDTPAQLEGYGPWIKSTDIPPETNMYGWMCYVVNFGNLYYCKKLED